MYKILLVVAIMVAVGWIAYGIWWLKVRFEEKKEPEPKEKSERLEKAQQSMEEYAKKMASYKRKTYEREDR